MIFKKQVKPVNKLSPLKTNSLKSSNSWKQKFKMNLYNKNYKSLLQNNIEHDIQEREDYNQAAGNFIQKVRKQYKNYKQKQSNNQYRIDHRYCVIIPLKKSVQFDDQMVNTFLYLRNLKQQNNFIEQDNFYSQIRKFLKQCKINNRLKEGWEICLKRFVVNLDILKRIDLFIQFQKNGSLNLYKLHQRYSKNTLIDVFIDRVMSCNRYFQKEVRLNKTWKISLQMNDKINEANISKTMKMLFCSICLIYDCGKHRLQDLSHRKNHHYSNPRNIIPKIKHISSAIQILKQLKQLQYGKKISKNKLCSENCFRKLDKLSYENLDLQKSRILSPMVQSIIKMGIQLFSYKPCLIVKLFPDSAPKHTQITCAIIFLYLIQQINLQSLLNYKINLSQTQYLKRQCSKQIPSVISKSFTKNLLLTKRKNIKKNNQQFKYQQVAICFHNYIGQDTFDQNCLNCSCHRRGFCLPQCQCGPDCLIMAKGCSCKSKQDCQTIKCLCYKSKNQCIPGICLNCFEDGCNMKKNQCKNDQILRGITKSIKVGFSKIPGAGFGAFAGQKIKKGSLISVYCGQVLDQQMQSIRQTLKKGQSFYNFACSIGSIDARYMGNKTRFINHGNQTQNKTNLISLNMFSCGQQYIGLYAIRDIQIGQQLLFDYDGDGQVAKTYSQIYSFLRKDGKIERISV